MTGFTQCVAARVKYIQNVPNNAAHMGALGDFSIVPQLPSSSVDFVEFECSRGSDCL